MSEPEDDGWVRHGGTDPFLAPEAERDAARRLRGRLALPVTVWTAWSAGRRAVGLTVSSTLLAEGDPPMVVGLLNPLTELCTAVQETGRFIVHVLAADQVRLADQMAGRYPDDPFRGVSITESEHGPILGDVRTRATCRFRGQHDTGWSVTVTGSIEAMELGPAERPLIHYRSGYYSTAPRRTPPPSP